MVTVAFLTGYDEESAVLGEVEARYNRMLNLRQEAETDPALAGRLAGHAANFGGYAKPGVILGMARAGVDPGSPVAATIARRSGEVAVRQSGGVRPGDTVNGSALSKLWGAAKVVTRGAFLGLAAPFEEASAFVSSVGEAAFDDTPGMGDVWSNYTQRAARSGLGMAFGELGRRVSEDGFQWDDLWRDSEEFIGSGVLPGGQIAARREADKQRLQLDGEFVTPGRLAARAVLEPGSRPYNLVSGMVDFTANVALDPANWLLGGASGAARAARTFGATFDDLPAAAKLMSNVSLLTGARKSVIGETVTDFLARPEGGLFLQTVADIDSPFRIWRGFGGKITREQAVGLAQASTPTDVADRVVEFLGATVARKPAARDFRTPLSQRSVPLPGTVPVARDATIGAEVVEMPRTQRRLHGLRFLQDLPSQILDLNDDVAPVRNFDAYLRNVKLPDDEVVGFVDEFMSYDKFDVEGLNGVVTRANERIVKELINRGKSPEHGRDLIKPVAGQWADFSRQARAYLLDAYGDDVIPPWANRKKLINGKEVIDPGGVAALLAHAKGDFIVLPDIRELRRATSWLGKVYDTPVIGGMTKGAVDLLGQVAMPAWKTLAILRPALGIRVVAEEQARIAAEGDASLWSHPIHAIAWALGRRGAVAPSGNVLADVARENGALSTRLKAVAGDADSPGYIGDFTRGYSNEPGAPGWWYSYLARFASDPVARMVAGGGNELTPQLSKSFDDFAGQWEMSSDTAAAIRRKLASGEPLTPAEQGFVEAVDFGPRAADMGDEPLPVYRGVVASDIPQVGQEIELPPSSFSYDPKVADSFARNRQAGTAGRGVVYEVTGDLPAHDVMVPGAAERETVAAGRFRVLDVDESGELTKVRLEYVGLRAGARRSVDPLQQVKDWFWDSQERQDLIRRLRADRPNGRIPKGIDTRAGSDDYIVNTVQLSLWDATGGNHAQGIPGDPELLAGLAKGRVLDLNITDGAMSESEMRAAQRAVVARLDGMRDKMPPVLPKPRRGSAGGPRRRTRVTRRTRMTAEDLAPGVRVRAADRSNLGTVVSVDEAAETARVHFANLSEGTTADVDLPLSSLSPERGRLADVIEDADQSWKERVDTVTDTMFGWFLTNPSDKFSRIVRHNQKFWQDLDRQIPFMTAEVQQQAIKGAADAGLGKLSARMAKRASRGSQGLIGSLADAETIAAAQALDATRKLLYDLANRSQFSEIMRIIAPFAEPWREVMTTWGRLVTENPRVLRRGQQVIEGARDADPDGDGRGFFYTDPSTGEEMFAYPGGHLVGKLLGLPGQVDLTGRATGLNLVATSLLPGFSPFVQIPAGYLIPDKPGWDGLADLIMPFGRAEEGTSPGGVLDTLLPAWMKRAVTALNADPEGDRVFANTVTDVMRLLASSGAYDNEMGLIDAEAQVRLLDDAKDKARNLYWVRALAQSTLPTGPQPLFSVDTPEGVMRLDALSGEFRKMQADDAQGGYATALDRFVGRFGYDAALSLTPKSRQIRFRSASKVGADWERDNADLLALLPNVAGYFAPDDPEGRFDYTAYLRSLRAGDRETLTPDEVLQLHNNTLGRLAYEQAQESLGEQAETVEGRALLARIRAGLREDYPGFQTTVGIPKGADLDTLIGEFRRAVEHPRLRDTEVGFAVREWLEVRDEATAAARQLDGRIRTFKSAEKARPIREWMREESLGLLARYPEFAPVWDRVFSRELEADEDVTEEAA